jgi:ribosome biogenesis GTPase
MNHDFNIKKMERYLTTAWNSGGQPIIILTKRDLCNDHNIYFNQLKGLAMGVPILSISSHTREGLDQLQPFFQPGKTIVFLGSSGVGKSSLLNTIAGIDLMKVNHIREDDSKGRHTTTHRQLVVLDNGSMIIDTPGMRELGMWDVTEGLNTTFSDIEEYAKNCKFSDCSHQTEGGCAIRTALDLGDLAISRWESYLKLEKEIKYAKSKENYKLRMKNKTNQKSLSKSRRNQEMVNFD